MICAQILFIAVNLRLPFFFFWRILWSSLINKRFTPWDHFLDLDRPCKFNLFPSLSGRLIRSFTLWQTNVLPACQTGPPFHRTARYKCFIPLSGEIHSFIWATVLPSYRSVGRFCRDPRNHLMSTVISCEHTAYILERQRFIPWLESQADYQKLKIQCLVFNKCLYTYIK